MRYLVTGSHGFLGSSLLRRFPKRNVITVPHEKLYDWMTLRNELPKDISFIFHCSAYGNMAQQKDIDEMVKANIVATHNLLLATEHIPYKSFVYISSSSVYGDKDHPMHETNSLEAKDYYGVTKIAAEEIIKAFVTQFDKPVVIARPFSIYGPREAKFRFIPTLIQCFKKKKPMKIAHGMHDWIYIDDVVDALMYIQEQAEAYKGKAINIGTGVQYDNYDLLLLLSEIANIDIEDLPLTHIPEMRTRKQWVADNSLLKSMGWLYRYSLREGLQKCYDLIK